MKLRVLGSAAGGGSPQWNCGCEVCCTVRSGGCTARPRTQSSIAVRGGGGPWYLVNASPDVRQQLEGLVRTGGLRESPIAAVILTDAEIDHTLGLLVLREGTTPLSVYGSEGVKAALSSSLPLLPALERYSGVAFTPLDPGSEVELDGLRVEAFDSGGGPPKYAPASQAGTLGLTFSDARGAVLTYVPGLARLDDALLERFAGSDCLLVDGTFWTDDELVRQGIGTRTAHDMGHLPLFGPGGTLESLERLERPRIYLVHVNNSNPALLDDSAERAAVRAAGAEVAHDGLELTL